MKKTLGGGGGGYCKILTTMLDRLKKVFNSDRLKRPKMLNIDRGGSCKFPT